MSKLKVKSTGYIVVQFPPPVPRDLGSELHRKIARLLDGAGSCSASHTGSLKNGRPGWCYAIYLKRPTTTSDWAERLMLFLREQEIPQETVLEVSTLRGSVEIPLPDLDERRGDLKRVMFTRGRQASANVRLEFAGQVDPFENLTARFAQSIMGYGEVTHAYKMPNAATVQMVIQDSRNLDSCITDVGNILRTQGLAAGVRLFISTQSYPEIIPIFTSSG